MISIVSAYHNRRDLLIQTLKSLELSRIKNFEFIIVDDCSENEHRVEDLCQKYNFLKVIRIEPHQKWWVNPCVPFNMGFNEASGDIVIIQNPECFHFCDIMDYVQKNLKENDYFSFACFSLDRINTENLNETIKKEFIINRTVPENELIEDGYDGWYNHSVYRPVGYHFCSAITKKNLDELGGFDERYAHGICYDDNEFLLRIKRKGLDFLIVDDEFVIHQWHKTFVYNREDAHVLQGKNRDLFHNITSNEITWQVNKPLNYKLIYENSFKNQNYNTHIDTEYRFQLVKKFVTDNIIKTILDVGSGRGQLIKILKDLNKEIQITSSDVKKFHEHDCEFTEINLCDDKLKDIKGMKKYDLITCLDVLEHIEEKCVDNTLKFFSEYSSNVILSIANHSDIIDGVELHIIQKTMSFWKPKIEKYFDIIYFEEQYSGRLYLLILKIKSTKVLVCGGAGYIGGLTCDYLIRDGFDVTIYDNLLYEPRFLKKIPFIYGDIRDTEKLLDASKNFDVIVLMSALVGDPACSVDPILTEEINHTSIKNFCNRIESDKHLIFMSTCSVYGAQEGELDEQSNTNPLSSYAKTKLAAEKYILDLGGTVFRLGTVFGIGDTYSRLRMDLVVNVLTMRAIKYGKIVINGGDQWRPIISVSDIADYICEAVKYKHTGIYILSKENVIVRELGERIVKIIPDTKITYTEISFQDARNYKVNNTKSLNVFGHKPKITVEEEVSRMIKIFKENRIQNLEDELYNNGLYLKNKKINNDLL
jgi:nucleoside-diphosphate-sugar epimerase/GT2 family glycosyltransferase